MCHDRFPASHLQSTIRDFSVLVIIILFQRNQGRADRGVFLAFPGSWFWVAAFRVYLVHTWVALNLHHNLP